MKTERDGRYRPTKNASGIDVVCPLDADETVAAGKPADDGDCVEKDVIERYSGYIEILPGS